MILNRSISIMLLQTQNFLTSAPCFTCLFHRLTGHFMGREVLGDEMKQSMRQATDQTDQLYSPY